MAEKTGIAWCDSTFNPWIGCTKVGPGCDHCYAEALDKRHRWGGAMHWGAGVPRKRTSDDYWKQPLAWDRRAKASGKRHLVFCASLADVFDNEVDPAWRRDLLELIAKTPRLTWLLLTKRIGIAHRMLEEALGIMSHGLTRWDDIPWPNVWIGASVVNQEEADRDVPKLLATPAAKRFVSYEPALGPIDFEALGPIKRNAMFGSRRLDWIIIGGESTQGATARPFDLKWAQTTVAQCRATGVSVFVKQIGSTPISRQGGVGIGKFNIAWPHKDHAGATPAEWPEELRVQEFPA